MKKCKFFLLITSSNIFKGKKRLPFLVRMIIDLDIDLCEITRDANKLTALHLAIQTGIIDKNNKKKVEEKRKSIFSDNRENRGNHGNSDNSGTSQKRRDET